VETNKNEDYCGIIMEIKNPPYFGKLLHKKGFRVWAMYMFRLIEGRDFTEEELHNGLFEVFQDIYNQKTFRQNINVPPRSGKTTLATYFIAYALAEDQKCNFIYTSFSQDLLGDISRSLSAILQHPAYQEMYFIEHEEVEELSNPIDDFWKDYLHKEKQKTVFSNKKIITKEGGVILFASIGSAITGFGAGIRSATKFSGCMFIDDANKPADIRSQTMRKKVQVYFSNTLLSRLNNSLIAIVNIQQRLHLEDLSGFLEKVYNFKTLKRPLVLDGICQLPSQYTQERILELQKDEFTFVSQYQQEPILEGGNLFKLETIKQVYAYELPEKYDWRFITADLSYKDKDSNDFVVFSYWGVKKEQLLDKLRDNLFLIDVRRKKINAVDVERWIDDWVKSKINYGFRYIWIEDKSHGIYLNQLYRRKGYPVPSEEALKETLPRDTDKVVRANNVIPCLDNINPNLIFNKDIENYDELLQELLAFNNSKHDDFVDTVIDGIKIGLFKEDIVTQWTNILGS
jgi:predicted phage terminase large subunit-like protein